MWKWFKKPKYPQQELRPIIEKYLQGDITNSHLISYNIRPIDRVNFQLVIDRWIQNSQEKTELLEYSQGNYYSEKGISSSLMSNELFLAPVERESFPTTNNESLDCIKRGLYLFRHRNHLVLLAIRPGYFSHEPPVLEIMALDRDAMNRT